MGFFTELQNIVSTDQDPSDLRRKSVDVHQRPLRLHAEEQILGL